MCTYSICLGYENFKVYALYRLRMNQYMGIFAVWVLKDVYGKWVRVWREGPCGAGCPGMA